MPRLFIALPVSPTFLTIPTEPVDVEGRVRWVPPARRHCTLHFAGEIGEEEADQLESAVTEHLLRVGPIMLRTEGYTFFPSRQRPRVLVALLARNDRLVRLHSSIQAAVEAMGMEVDARSYRPHVTIARLRSLPPEETHALYRTLPHDFAEETVDTVILYESVLGAEGPTYTKRRIWSLPAK